ncbi:CG0192 family protein [Corynebacterium sp. A21]|uniref:CG0192 family protein n=1 Tax=Corynebacterium sp. A21 TaxID=3457318 RepID=UPI003FD3A4A4
MSGIAEIFDAELNPDKNYIAQTIGGFKTLLGSYRLVDTIDGEGGIEVLIGRDQDDRLVQLPLTYRSTEVDPAHTLVELEHSVLGHRWVSNALGDPVAVREFIRTIITADDGAAYSDGTIPAVNIQGSGSRYAADVEIGEVRLLESTNQRAEGTVVIDGRSRIFGLRLPRILAAKKAVGVDYTATRLHLHGTTPEQPDEELRVAEFFWREAEN